MASLLLLAGTAWLLAALVRPLGLAGSLWPASRALPPGGVVLPALP